MDMIAATCDWIAAATATEASAILARNGNPTEVVVSRTGHAWAGRADDWTHIRSANAHSTARELAVMAAGYYPHLPID